MDDLLFANDPRVLCVECGVRRAHFRSGDRDLCAEHTVPSKSARIAFTEAHCRPRPAIHYMAESTAKIDAHLSVGTTPRPNCVIYRVDAEVGFRKFEREHENFIEKLTPTEASRIETIYYAAFWAVVREKVAA
jgi:hypothetical protein